MHIIYGVDDVNPFHLVLFLKMLETGLTPVAVDVYDADFSKPQEFFDDVPDKERGLNVLRTHGGEAVVAHPGIFRVGGRRGELHQARGKFFVAK